MANMVHILLVEDDDDDFLIARSVLREIPNLNFKLDWLKSFDEAKETIASERHHLYLFDYLLGRNSGLDLLKILKEKDEDLPAILLTGKGDARIDQKAIELGAYDYLEKSTFNAGELGRSIRYALKHANTLAALRASEQKYRRVFEHSKEIIFIANEDFNIVNVSKTVSDFTGYTPSEVYSMQSHEYFENPLQIIKMQDLMVKDGSIKDFQIHLKAKNGEVKTGLVSCVLENKGAGKFFLHGIFSDQTEKIKAERALTQSRKLESTARLMQVLAHEVRNPLMNINFALDSLSDKTKEEDEEVLEIIQRNAKRIDTLINEVLHAASEKAIERRSTNLSDIIETALAKVLDRARIRQVQIESAIEGCPRVLLHPEQISTALVNILINAIEALENRLEPKVKLHSYREGEQAVIIISDNGIGMDEALQTMLFEPFYTAKTNGVGLGLAATLGILKAHEAEIEVKSEVGIGSIFTLRFNVVKQD
ncbi:MAG: PAS domain S-box-containing protein [Algoriphagus sp.]|jgi:PAS domain S-box-containing protein